MTGHLGNRIGQALAIMITLASLSCNDQPVSPTIGPTSVRSPLPTGVATPGNYFTADDLLRTQMYVPYVILVPTYVPANFTGPYFLVDSSEDYPVTFIDTSYVRGDSALRIQQHNGTLARQSEAQMIQVEGVSVFLEEYKSPAGDAIVSVGFGLGETSLRIEGWNLEKAEVLKVVRSILSK